MIVISDNGHVRNRKIDFRLEKSSFDNFRKMIFDDVNYEKFYGFHISFEHLIIENG